MLNFLKGLFFKKEVKSTRITDVKVLQELGRKHLRENR